MVKKSHISNSNVEHAEERAIGYTNGHSGHSGHSGHGLVRAYEDSRTSFGSHINNFKIGHLNKKGGYRHKKKKSRRKILKKRGGTRRTKRRTKRRNKRSRRRGR